MSLKDLTPLDFWLQPEMTRTIISDGRVINSRSRGTKMSPGEAKPS